MTVKELKDVCANFTNICINIGSDKNNTARLRVDHDEYDNAIVKKIFIADTNLITVEVEKDV